jgi:hypothetical protein
MEYVAEVVRREIEAERARRSSGSTRSWQRGRAEPPPALVKFEADRHGMHIVRGLPVFLAAARCTAAAGAVAPGAGHHGRAALLTGGTLAGPDAYPPPWCPVTRWRTITTRHARRGCPCRQRRGNGAV